MKLIVSFYGMCLCVLEGTKGNRARSASVLLLNGATPPPKNTKRILSRQQLPYHHPLLFVPAKHVDLARSSPPLPTPDALVDTEGLMSGRHHGWSLSGLDVTLGTGKGVSLRETLELDAAGRLPDPRSTKDTLAYEDWRRLPDLSRIAPGAKLRSAFTTIGANVLGAVRFTGGELRGALPKDRRRMQAWRFSDSFDQVITNRFEFHCNLPGVEISAVGKAGGRPSVIRLSGTAGKVVRLAVVHEATPADAALHARALPSAQRSLDALPHYMAFYDAIQGKAVDRLQPPERSAAGARGRIRVIDTPECPPATFPQP
ncbi:MAG: hypothetical protein AB7O28_18185 [Vicinamibacterales bacterium]